jgi:hypothetical protein
MLMGDDVARNGYMSLTAGVLWLLELGPGRGCMPRHRMPSNS